MHNSMNISKETHEEPAKHSGIPQKGTALYKPLSQRVWSSSNHTSQGKAFQNAIEII